MMQPLLLGDGVFLSTQFLLMAVGFVIRFGIEESPEFADAQKKEKPWTIRLRNC